MDSPEAGLVACQCRQQEDTGEGQSQKIGKRQADQQPSELFQPVCPVEVKETNQHISQKAEGADIHKVIVADKSQCNADCKKRKGFFPLRVHHPLRTEKHQRKQNHVRKIRRMHNPKPEGKAAEHIEKRP